MTITTAYQNINMSNVSTVSGMLDAMNQSGAGYLFTAINMLVFFVLLISLSGLFGWEAAILSSGFISIILSILFVYMGVMSFWIAGAFVGLILAIMMYVIWSNRNN